MGVIAATSIPAFTSIDQARKAAATNEVERVLIMARAHAMATSRPTGVEISADGSTLSLVEIVESESEPAAVADVFGAPMQGVDLAGGYGGAIASSLVNGDGSSGTRTIWFNHRAEPQTRSESGDLVGAFTQDAVITMSTGAKVRVRMISGAVEQE